MIPSSTLVELIEVERPIPVDINNQRNSQFGKQVYLEPTRVADGQPLRGDFFKIRSDQFTWGEPQLGAYLSAIKQNESTVLPSSSNRPRLVDNLPLSSCTRVSNVISLTSDTAFEIQNKLRSSAFECTQLQVRLENLSNFFFIYALQKVRLQTSNWQGALAGYLCRLTAAALPPKPEGEEALGLNAIGDSLRPHVLSHIIASISPYLEHRPGALSAAERVDEVRSDLASDLDFQIAQSLSRSGVAEQDIGVAKQFLKAAMGAALAVLEKILGVQLPNISKLRHALSSTLFGRELVCIRRIEKRYGVFLPGELLTLATGEVALVYGANFHLREPKLIRVIGANGVPYTEPLYTRSPQTIRTARRCANVKIPSTLNYPAIVSALRLA